MTSKDNQHPAQPLSKKYSDLMRWQREMLKSVGLSIPEQKTKEVPSQPDNTIEVIFLKRSKTSEQM